MNVSTRTSNRTNTVANGLGTSIGKANLLAKPARMMRWLFVLLMFVTAAANAQTISATTYPLTTGTGATLEDMSTGTTEIVAANTDDGGGNGLMNIGFDYWFVGTRYTTFGASANGFVRLGGTIPGSDWTNSMATSTFNPIIAPYWDDLWTGTNGKVHYKTIGTAPNRKLVVEWLNMQVPRVGSGASGAGTFQLWLSETSGKIEMVYGSGMITNSANSGYSVGLANSSTVFGSVTTNGGTISYATANNAQTDAITSGTKYTFTPISSMAAASGLTFSSVGLTSMQLNWTAASPTTGIVRYAIYGSTDGGVTFQYYGQTANATATSLAVSGLTANTSYVWRVYSVSEGALGSSYPEESQATNACSLAGGTYSVGPTGTYASLTAAIAAITANGITGSVILELQPTYVSSVETFPIVLGAVACANSGTTVTIRPQSGSIGLSITSASTTATIDFNGGKYYTIDGRPGGSGSADLAIGNTTTAGIPIRFVNDATNNTVKYATVTGSNTSTTGGMIVFSTTTGTTGNDNNTIDNCDLNGGGTAGNIIYASGTTTNTTTYNSGVTISNNKIHDQFLAGSSTSGILVSGGNTDWTITGNSIYQTASRTYTTGATHYGIQIASSTAGNNFVISNNYIGGGAVNAGGSAWTAAGAVANRFQGISLSVAATTATSVQGNTIANFNWSSSSGATTLPGVWCGIYLSAGVANIGTTTGNTIGSGTGNGSILSTTSTTGGVSVGIGTTTTATGNVSINNNVIGSINVAGSTASISHTFNAIWNTSSITGLYTVNGNTIGSTSTSNSVQYSSAGTGTTAAVITGILQAAAPSLGAYITNNTIANLNNTYVPAAANTSTHIRGIWASSGRDSIAGNTVRNLTVASNGTGTGSSASVIGIGNVSSTTGSSYIRANTIHSLANNNSTAASYVSGIVYNGPTTAGMIDRNLIHSLNSPSTSALVNGINIVGATATYQNNMIRLGIDASGTAIVTATNYNGILETAGTNNIWHNTVYIGGTGVNATPATSTYAFYNNATLTSTRSIRNNIFMNERSASSGTSKHYAIRMGGTTPPFTGLTINNNIYRATGATTGVLGFINGADVTTLGAWQTASGQDANSLNANPCLNNPTAGTPNLHLTDCSTAGSPADGVGANVGVTDDYDQDVRVNLTPTDIGADAGNYGAVGADVGLSALVTPAVPTGCLTATETVSVTLKNYGLTTIDFSTNNVTVTVTATGPTGPYSSNIVISSGTLASNATQTVTLPATIDMTLRGTYTFNGTAVVAADVNTVNDALPTTSRVYNTLGGSYNVGTGGDFTTLTAAIAAYNGATCITGPITFNLTNTAPYNIANGETFPITINNQALASATNTLTIKPATGVTASITEAVASNRLIKIVNNNYVTIDGSNNGTTSRDLTISNTSTTSPSVIWIGSTGTTPIHHVTVKNAIISNGVNTSTAVIVSDGASAGTAGYFNNITIQNNSIRKAYMGVYGIAVVAAGNGNAYTLNGNSLNNTGADAIRYVGLYLQGIDGASVTNNTIGSFDNTISEIDRGIWLATDVKNTTVSGNTISNLDVNASGTSNPVGINITSGITGANISVTGNTITGLTSIGTGTTTGIVSTIGTGGVTISKNKIGDIKNTAASGSAVGIVLSSTSTSAATLVSNNFIYDVAGAGGSTNGYGIVVASGAGYSIYNNSVSLNQAVAGTTADVYVAAAVTDAGAINLRNNILANNQASGNRYAVYSLAANTVFAAIDYNDYYVPGGSLGYISFDRNTLADMQTGFGGNTNSKNVAPVFTSATDLHLNTILNINLNAAATSIGSVTDDIDGDTRSGTPDMGADEFSPAPGLNVGLTALVAPGTNGCHTGPENVTVQLTNSSIDPIDFSVDNVTVNVTATGGYNSTTTLTTGTLAAGASMNVTMPTQYDMSVVGSYTFNGTATVVGDIYTGNDAMPTTVLSTVAATVGTVSVTSPSSASYCLTAGRPVMQLSSAAGGVIQWQSSTVSNSGPWTNVGTDSLRFTEPSAITATTYYRATVTCGATTVNSNVVTVTFNNPQVLTTTPETRCGVGSVPLAATASAGATLNWYAASTGGTSLGTGTTFNTPSINTTTTYYVDASIGGSNINMGPASPTAQGGTIGTQTVAWNVNFTTTQPTTIQSVDIYPVASGQAGVIQVITGSTTGGTVLATINYTTSVSGGATAQTIPINYTLGTPGSYNLYTSTMPSSGITRNTSGQTYPVTSAVASITGNGFDQTYWMGMYNWVFAAGCTSARTPVTATVNPSPAVTISPATPAAICLNQSSSFTASGTGYTNFAWTATPSGTAGIASPSAATTSVTPTAAGTYTYTVTANDGTGPLGCANTASVNLTVNPIPNPVTITPAAATVCVGGNVSLTATSLLPQVVSSYTFAASTGASLDPMTGATEVITNSDDDTPTSSPASIGFTFRLNDVDYTQYSVSPDGWILLGGATAADEYVNAVTSTSNIPKLYPYWDDLATGTDGHVRVLVTGSAPSRIFKVQWQVTIPRNTTGATNSTFQAWLYEGSNKIEYRYGTMGTPTSASISGGITVSATNYQSLSFATNTSSSASANDANSVAPASGTMYTYSPQVAPITWSPATYLNTTSGNTVISTPTADITYTATATLGSCTVSNTVPVTVSTLAVSASVAQNVLCNGGNSGSITASGSGGTTPYEYSLNGTTWQSGTTFSGLTAGSYTIYIRDANSPQCTVTGNTVTITEPTALNASVGSSSDPVCHDGTNGSVTISATGGTGAYSFSLDAGAQTNGTGTFSGLASGSHSVVVTDANGCTTTVNFTLNNPALISLSASTSSPVCAGADATLTATPGTYVSYSWTGPGTINNANTAVATAVAPTNGDIFTVTATDANGCSNSATVTVAVTNNAPVSVSISVSPSNEICSETPVTFTATPVNGGATPAYQWYLNGVAQTGETASTYVNANLNDQDAVYVVVTSSLPCTTGSPATSNTQTITVVGIQNVSVVLAASANNVCSGTSVTYTATPTGGGASPTYEFFVNATSVQGPSATNTYTYTPANGDVVTVVLTSSSTCAIGNPATSDPVTMTVYTTPAAPTVTAGGAITFCNGGSVTLTSSYSGSGNVWSPGGATTDNITVSTSGSYTVVYTSVDGCPSPASTPVVVTVNANPVATITGTPAICTGGSTTLDASTSTAGSGTITGYQWVLNGVTNLGTAATQVVNAVGSYTVIVTNSNGCSTTSVATTVTENAVPTAVATTNCSVLSPGQTATLDASTSTAGSGTITGYQWVLNGVTNLGTGVTQAATAAGSYTVIVTNSNGCSTTSAPVVISALSGALVGGTTYNIPSTCGGFPTIASAVTYVNANGITGSGNVTFSVADGYTETAPAGGYALTATGSATNGIIFQQSGSGTKPVITAPAQTAGSITDAIFKIVGGDYITFKGFDLRENAANQTNTLASNNRTEFGIAMFIASATDGAQNNTIQDNVINLASGGANYQNSIAVFSTSSSSQSNGVLAATATSGTNSNNKVYGNTISNVAFGIYTICEPITATITESGNDIGGASAGTGNNITYGVNTAADFTWTRFSTASGGIIQRNGAGNNVSYNTVSTISTLTVASTAVGISSASAPVGVTYTSTMNNNTVTMTNTGTTAMTGIDFGHGISTGTITANSNTITLNQSATAAVSAAVIGLKANYATAGSTVNSNSVTVNQSLTVGAATTNSSAVTGITLPNGTTGTPVVTANSNTVLINRSTNVSAGTGTMSGAIVGIQATTATSTVTIGASGAGNTVTVKEAAAGAGTTTYSSAITYVDVSAGHGTANVGYNTFNTTGSTLRSTGQAIMVKPEGTVTALYNISNNTATIDRVAASGNLSFTLQTGGPSNVADTVSNNVITFTNLSGTASANGISQLGGPTGSGLKYINNNTINISGTHSGTTKGIVWGYAINAAGSKISGNNVTISSAGTTVSGIEGSGTSAAAGLALSNNSITLTSTGVSPTMIGISGASTGPYKIFGNTINSITASAASTSAPVLTGIQVSVGTNDSIYNNLVKNLTTGAGSGTATVTGIVFSGGTTASIYKNKIVDIGTSNTGASSLVAGLRVSAATTSINVFNNYIGGLTASAVPSLDAIRGINLTSTSSSSQMNVYYNTVYINATGPAATFGTSAIYHTTSTTATTAALNMRNNILVNTSTPGTAGITAAYRRSSTTLTNYVATSNNNLYYAGTAAANRVLFYDGSTGDQTIAALKTRMSTRDQQSVEEDATTKFLSTTTSASNYLHIDPSIQTAIEGGAAAISGFTDDYDGDTRNATTPDIGADEINGTPLPCTGAVGGTASGAAFVCEATTNTTITVTGASTGGGITYQWEVSTTGGGVGFAPVVGGTGATTIAYTTPTGIAAGTYYYRLATTCSAGPVTAYSTEYTLVVRHTPTASASNSGPVCSGTTLSLTGTSDATGVTASFAWSGPAGFTSTQQNPTLTAPFNGSGTYTFTATLNGCSNVSTTTVVVNLTPSPITITPASITICEGQSVNLVATGGAQEGTATIGSGVVANTTTTPYKGFWGGHKAQFLYTAAELSSAGLASGVSITTLNLPVTAFSSPYTFNNFTISMKNTATTALTSTPESGTTTVFGPTTYTLSGTAPFTISHTITPFVWDGTSNVVVEFCFNNVDGGGTSSNSATVTSTAVTGGATYFSADNTATVCSTTSGWTTSTSRANIGFGYVGAVYPITWSPSTGLNTTSGPSVTASPATTQTYTATATNGSCTSAQSVTVTVNPKPDGASISVDNNTVCQNGTAPVITFSANVGTGPYTFTYNINGGANQTITTASGANPLSVNLPVPTATAGTYVYTITNLSDIYCTNTATGSVTVTVNATTPVDFSGLPSTICTNAATVTLTPTVSGGTFSGTGVSGSTFNPAVAGAGGPYTITYTYTNGSGCVSTATHTVTVNAVTTPTFSGLPATICNNAAAVTLTGTPSGGTFSGTGISGNTFDPAVAGAGGPYTITYTYTNGSGCTASSSQTVTVTTCTPFATLELDVFLEGFYMGGGALQPNLSTVEISTDPTESDTITVNLWAPANLANTDPDYSVVGVLHTDGHASIQFPGATIGNSYYVAVKHRNHVETWSHDPVAFTATTNYDFTQALSSAYDDGVNPPMKALGDGNYGLYAGDINQDGTVDGQDMNVIDNNNGFFGYDNSDINGDGATDGQDMNFVDNNSQLGLFYARPY